MTVSISVVIAFFILNAGLIYAACNMRCPVNGDSVIICDGDTKFDTVRKCGEPDYVEDIGIIFSGRFGSVANSTGTEGSYEELAKSVEKWYYNCGEGRFMKIITFQGNEVVMIENGDYGSGPQKCW